MSSADFALTVDRALVLRVDSLVQDKTSTWIPRNRIPLAMNHELEFSNGASAVLSVEADRGLVEQPDVQRDAIALPTLTLANVRRSHVPRSTRIEWRLRHSR